MLKEGAKVILIKKNIADGLYNGMTGIVHHLEKDSPPIVNFNGNLVSVPMTKFDIFDTKQNKNLASRSQIPIILAFALTVHRAQGQTLKNVEVDCYSFFSPGQMGVAIGRAISMSGLRVLNFNQKAASTKHPEIVYNFYERDFANFDDDLSCCENNTPVSQMSSTEDEQLTSSTHESLISIQDGSSTVLQRCR